MTIPGGFLARFLNHQQLGETSPRRRPFAPQESRPGPIHSASHERSCLATEKRGPIRFGRTQTAAALTWYLENIPVGSRSHVFFRQLYGWL